MAYKKKGDLFQAMEHVLRYVEAVEDEAEKEDAEEVSWHEWRSTDRGRPWSSAFPRHPRTASPTMASGSTEAARAHPPGAASFVHCVGQAMLWRLIRSASTSAAGSKEAVGARG